MKIFYASQGDNARGNGVGQNARITPARSLVMVRLLATQEVIGSRTTLAGLLFPHLSDAEVPM
jgi:hypothetical protein